MNLEDYLAMLQKMAEKERKRNAETDETSGKSGSSDFNAQRNSFFDPYYS